MSFLKKFGAIALNVLQYVILGGGASQAVIPSGNKVTQFVDKLTQMASQALIIEQAFANAFAGQQTGPQKLKALIPAVGQIVASSEVVVGHKVSDPVLFRKALEEYAQATVDLLNSLSGDNVEAKAPQDLDWQNLVS